MTMASFVGVSTPTVGVSTRLRPRRDTTARAADDKFASYTPKKAFFFPGQGAQSVGMAKELTEELPKAKEMFEQASEILGYDLLKVCVEGPEDKLNTTAVSQPAIYVASLAAVEKLRAEKGDEFLSQIDVCCGLSLGEYTALTFAGAMTFEDGVRLVKIRGESMQAAADLKPSGMASVIGLDVDKVNELCEAVNKEVGPDDQVKIANYLCPGNYAVSGGIKGIDLVAAKAKPEFKARMAVKLAVAGAFHTEFMAPAADSLREALAGTKIQEPIIPVVSNVDVMPHSDPDTIKDILSRQLTGPVQWEKTLVTLKVRLQWEKTLVTLKEKGLEEGFEVGPGKVIAGIWKRIDKGFNIVNVLA